MSGQAPRNVLIVHHSAELYGSDKVLLLIVEGLITRAQFHPIVLLPEEGRLTAELRKCGAEVHVVEVARINRSLFTPAGVARVIGSARRSIREIDRVVAGRSISVVHSNTVAVLSGAVWAALRRRPHLWHVHEIIRSPRVVSAGLPKLVARMSDMVVSNSRPTEQWLRENSSLEANCSRVIFNALPAPPRTSVEEVAAIRRVSGAEDGDVLIAMVGRLNKWKGQDLLIDAVSRLMKTANGSGPSFKVVIVGGPAPGTEHLVDKLKARVHDGALGQIVSFLPFLADVWPVWRAADIAVVPSKEPEPFGMVAIEAMAAGKPVVAAAHGGLLDIVVDGETGVLFTPNDAVAFAGALKTLILDRDLRMRLGAGGQARQVLHFSIDGQVLAMESAYSECESAFATN